MQSFSRVSAHLICWSVSHHYHLLVHMHAYMTVILFMSAFMCDTVLFNLAELRKEKGARFSCAAAGPAAPSAAQPLQLQNGRAPSPMRLAEPAMRALASPRGPQFSSPTMRNARQLQGSSRYIDSILRPCTRASISSFMPCVFIW